MRHRKSGVIAVAYNPLKAVGIIGVAGRNRSPKTDYPRCDTPLPSEPVPQVTDHVGDGQVAQGYHLRERADQTALLAVERATDQLAGIRNRSDAARMPCWAPAANRSYACSACPRSLADVSRHCSSASLMRVSICLICCDLSALMPSLTFARRESRLRRPAWVMAASITTTTNDSPATA